MKRICCFMLACCLLLSGCIYIPPEIVYKDYENLPTNHARLIVFGEAVDAEHVYVDTEEGIVLPLVEVSEALGAKITWISKHKARIKFEDETYWFNLEKVSLKRNAVEGNILMAAPGGSLRYVKRIDGDVLLGITIIMDYLERHRGVRAKLHSDGITVMIETLEGNR